MLDKVAPEPKKAKTSGTMFATPCAIACLGQLGERAQRTQALPSDPDDNTTPAIPTPPVAPVTNSVSPALRAQRSISAL